MTTTLAGTLTTAKNAANPNALTLNYPYLTNTTTPKDTGRSRNTVSNVTYYYDVNPAFYAQNTGFSLLRFNHSTNNTVPIKNVSVLCKPVNGSGVVQTAGTFTIEWWVMNTKQDGGWAIFDNTPSTSGPGPILADFEQYHPNALIYPRLTAVGGGATGVEIWVDGISLEAIPQPTA